MVRYDEEEPRSRLLEEFIEGAWGYKIDTLGQLFTRRTKSGPKGDWRQRSSTPWAVGYVYYAISCGGLGKPARRLVISGHRLVLEAFVGPCPPGMEACHNDGDRTNNRLSNVRWDTHRNNVEDTIRHGTRPTGEKCHSAKLRDVDVAEIRRLHRERPDLTNKQIGEMFGVVEHTIIRIAKGHLWRDVCEGGGSSNFSRARGSAHPRSKLNEESVRRIRAEHQGGVRVVDLAKKYEVDSSTISKILTRSKWSYVE